jgi:hypothetical protein
MRGPAVTLLVSFLVVLGLIWMTGDTLPSHVASHFDASGTPDGWMSRNTYLGWMSGVAIGVSGVFVSIFLGIRFLPPSTINLPRREYWLAPERSASTMAFLMRAGIWLACISLWLLLGVHLFVLSANSSEPVHLSAAIWLLAPLFGLVTLLWSWFLIRHFTRGFE